MTKESLIGVGVPFDRVRRITGYLAKTTRFNDAKKQELDQRVKHSLTGVRCSSCESANAA